MIAMYNWLMGIELPRSSELLTIRPELGRKPILDLIRAARMSIPYTPLDSGSELFSHCPRLSVFIDGS